GTAGTCYAGGGRRSKAARRVSAWRGCPYEIRVKSVLDSRWAARFDGLQVIGEGEETVISGLLADQPALDGLLAKIRDLGLCLISVRRLGTGEVSDGTPQAEAGTDA